MVAAGMEGEGCQMIWLDENFEFEGSSPENRLVNLPKYLEQLFHEQDSPFRCFLYDVTPPCNVRVKIEVEVIKEGK